MPAVVHRIRSPGLSIALALIASVMACAPASAQSLFQSLFGFGSPPPRPMPQYYQQRPVSPYYTPFGRSGQGSGIGGGGGSGGGSYRTVCVRMCDGYYFPISHGVSRAQLTRDAAACQSSCGTDARLFYAPSNGSADDFVDLGGRSYTQIPNAFKYRKALSPACACKPAPWSETELARHQRYAAEAARTAAPVAVTQPDPSTSQGRLAASGKPDSRPDGQPAGKAKATAVAAGGSGTSVMVVEAPPPASAAKDASGSHAVQDAAAAKAPAQPHAAASATLSEPQHIKPPAVAGPSRVAGSSTGPSARPAPRAGAGGPAQPQVKVATKPAASAAPVYSHEQGRFVFPGDRRYQ